MTWALVFWDIVAVIFWACAFFKVVQRPARSYDLGWVGKTTTIVVVGLGSTFLAGWLLPVAAFVIFWRHRNRHEVPDIPIADGWPGS